MQRDKLTSDPKYFTNCQTYSLSMDMTETLTLTNSSMETSICLKCPYDLQHWNIMDPKPRFQQCPELMEETQRNLQWWLMQKNQCRGQGHQARLTYNPFTSHNKWSNDVINYMEPFWIPQKDHDQPDRSNSSTSMQKGWSKLTWILTINLCDNFLTHLNERTSQNHQLSQVTKWGSSWKQIQQTMGIVKWKILEKKGSNLHIIRYLPQINNWHQITMMQQSWDETTNIKWQPNEISHRY